MLSEAREKFLAGYCAHRNCGHFPLHFGHVRKTSPLAVGDVFRWAGNGLLPGGTYRVTALEPEPAGFRVLYTEQII